MGDLRAIVRFAESHGWTVTYNSKGHVEFWAPGADPAGRATVIAAGTTSDYRSLRNLIADLRRAGLPIPHKGHTPKKGS